MSSARSDPQRAGWRRGRAITWRILTIARFTQPEDDAVDRDAEIERAEAAQEGGGLARVADLGELDVGHHAGAAPEPRVEEDGQHAAGDHVPPEPVAGDAVARDHAGDDQRRVGGEGRRDHRRAGQPPRDVAAREEELGRAAARAPGVVQPDRQVQREVAGDDEPVDQGERHGLIAGIQPSWPSGVRRPR